mmetsp:Transcript_8095/g.17697  ORF Transcript_8095/g.17697 Transcript_8095/m.17697 type:complete len:202 (+) Transcript_8095:302-907(+)
MVGGAEVRAGLSVRCALPTCRPSPVMQSCSAVASPCTSTPPPTFLSAKISGDSSDSSPADDTTARAATRTASKGRVRERTTTAANPTTTTRVTVQTATLEMSDSVVVSRTLSRASDAGPSASSRGTHVMRAKSAVSGLWWATSHVSPSPSSHRVVPDPCSTRAMSSPGASVSMVTREVRSQRLSASTTPVRVSTREANPLA